MNKLLIALALVTTSVTALSLPAAAAVTKSDVRSAQDQMSAPRDKSIKESSADQRKDPYWSPCHYSHAGYNTCD